MKENELLEKLNSSRAAGIFKELYGDGEIGLARQRYTKLITGMVKGFPESELTNTIGKLRVFSAPGRTELAGNHTDHNRGKVLAASIQLDCAAVVQVRNDNIVFFRSTGFPDVKIFLNDASNMPDLLPKSSEEGTTDALIRGVAAELYKRGCKIGGFSANAESTVLPGSGLSSSASLEVLIGRIFDSLYGDGSRTSLDLAQIGQIAENVYFGKPCGLMDQVACASGGAAAIDFTDVAKPIIKQINVDFSAAGYAICIVNTGGSHANLTSDYASIPSEMKAVAAVFGKSVLGELDKDTVLSNIAEVRKKHGDRALLRAIHFFDECSRVDELVKLLAEMDNSGETNHAVTVMDQYLNLINDSGDSSWKILQNVFSPGNPHEQGITVGLALTKDFLNKQKLKGVCRVHGGGFAGTIQTYIPLHAVDEYREYMDKIFGAGSVTVLRIRPRGSIELELE